MLNLILLSNNLKIEHICYQCWASLNSLSWNSRVRSKCLSFELNLTHFFKNERESSETQNFCEFWVKIKTQTQVHLFFLILRFFFLTIFLQSAKRGNLMYKQIYEVCINLEQKLLWKRRIQKKAPINKRALLLHYNTYTVLIQDIRGKSSEQNRHIWNL